MLGFSPSMVSSQTPQWDIPEGSSLEIHSSGFELPTAIAFILNRLPEGPLYYVTELNGTVKSVSQNGEVRIVGIVQSIPHTVESEPDEFGTAGICVSEGGEYLFVTYAYKDQTNILRNGIVRLLPSKKDLGGVFQDSISGYGHQVGPCQIEGNHLYVGVGDGLQSSSAQDLSDPRGKILRMDFEGLPVEENPFYLEDGKNSPSDYVYALGLRNPFGLKLVRGKDKSRLYAADNGNSIDRILEVRKGRNYLWDGTDASIASRNRFILLDSGGTAALDYDPVGDSFYLVRTKDPARVQSFRLPSEGLQTIIRWSGPGDQVLSGMAVGEGRELYFAPLFGSEVLKLQLVKGRGNSLSPILVGERLVRKYGCQGCHQIQGEGGSLGPSLDPVSKPEDWIAQKLLNPRFESSDSIMPDLGISEGEAQTLAQWLLETEERRIDSLSDSILRWFLPPPGEYNRRWLVAYFLIGTQFTAVFLGLFLGLWLVIRSRR